MKQVARLTLILCLMLSALMFSESVKRSSYLEGVVVRAQRFRCSGRFTTKITLQEDADYPAAGTRRFCGDWQQKINRFRGKRIHVDLYYKEYAPGECQRIKSIRVLSGFANSN